ncbi:MAG: alpha/beta hydrolase [Eubacteriales bacterium]
MRLKNFMLEQLKIPGIAYKMVKQNKGISTDKYEYGEDPKQHFLYFKAKRPFKKQLIVYLHGGGWKNGSPEEFKFIGDTFARRGFHVVSLGYRHAPKNKYPAQAQDVATAFNKALEVMKLKGVDTQNIVLVGSSAGGHLAGILAYDKGLQQEYGIDANSIKGLILLGSPIALDVCKNRSITALLNKLFKEDYDRKTADPVKLIDGSEKIQVLCIHSKRDPICEFENSVLFTDKVNRFNPGLAGCIIVKCKGMYHSNLVAGIFLKEISSCKILRDLFGWLDRLN